MLGRYLVPMSQPPEKSQPQDKAARLAAALKANLARRKAQARARNDSSPAGSAPGEEDPAARESSITSEPGEAAIVPTGKAR